MIINNLKKNDGWLEVDYGLMEGIIFGSTLINENKAVAILNEVVLTHFNKQNNKF